MLPLAALILTGCPGNGKAGSTTSGGTTFTLIALAEVRGQIEPCGCTTDPLGDLARTAQLVTEAKARGPVVVVDAGSLLYTKAPLPPHLKDQEELKATLLAQVYKDELNVAGIGLGPLDLAAGPAGVRLPRQVANLPAGGPIPLAAPRVIAVGADKIGVFGVIDPALVPDLGASDPAAAARQAVDGLRAQGATRVIGLATMSRKDAARLVRATPGIDVMVVGLGQAAPEPKEVLAQAEQIGDTWMVFPANRGQVVSRFEVTLRPGGGPLIDAIGPAAAAARKGELDARLALMDEELTRFAADPTADPAFVQQHKAERARLAAERDALAATPLRVPPQGSWFQLAQVKIARGLACDGDVVGLKYGYARDAGIANVAAAKARPAPPPPPPGTATYVGVAACADCHEDAVGFWKTTRHAQAWKTLVEVGKQFDYDCIGCHTTGWDEPGGATMAHVDDRMDVQCETCHGPGSLHVDADEADVKKTIRLAPDAGMCATRCHTAEHSDTFERTAYLRDVIGPGHGEKARAILGSGATGHELRAAGLAKAGAAIGAGCPK